MRPWHRCHLQMHVMQIRLKQVFGLRPLQQLDVDVHGEVISAGVAREPGRAGARYTEAAQSPVRLRTHHGRVFLRKLSETSFIVFISMIVNRFLLNLLSG